MKTNVCQDQQSQRIASIESDKLGVNIYIYKGPFAKTYKILCDFLPLSLPGFVDSMGKAVKRISNYPDAKLGAIYMKTNDNPIDVLHKALEDYENRSQLVSE